MAARTLYAQFTARPGHEDEVERLVAGFTDKVRKEPGNVTFIAHRLVRDPAVFFVYEEYTDAAAFDAHVNAAYGIAFNTELVQHIVEAESRLTWLTRV